APQRDARRAAMECPKPTGRGPGALRKEQQGPTPPETLGASLDQVFRPIVGDVAGALHDQTKEKVPSGRALHNAIRLWHRSDKEHYIDQRRVIGDHENGASAQSLLTRPRHSDEP